MLQQGRQISVVIGTWTQQPPFQSRANVKHYHLWYYKTCIGSSMTSDCVWLAYTTSILVVQEKNFVFFHSEVLHWTSKHSNFHLQTDIQPPERRQNLTKCVTESGNTYWKLKYLWFKKTYLKLSCINWLQGTPEMKRYL